MIPSEAPLLVHYGREPCNIPLFGVNSPPPAIRRLHESEDILLTRLGKRIARGRFGLFYGTGTIIVLPNGPAQALC